MELHRLRRRRRIAALLTALTASALVVAGTGPATAVEDVESERLAGENRFETAAEIAVAGFPDGSDFAVVASGRAFPDALAGAALGLPVLLTERDSLPGATADVIEALGASDVIVLGGTASVSEDVADELGESATVQRIAGSDRYETAAMIAEAIGADGVAAVDELQTAIFATGAAFADALAGGPISTGGAGADVLPVLLVSDAVPPATAAAIDELGIEQAIILGGTGAVPASVQTELEDLTGNAAVRLAGTNRYGTAVAVAEFAIETLAFPVESTILASGAEFADALAGGPLGGVRQAPLLLSDPAQLPDESEAFFEEHADTIETITTLGGTAAVSQSSAESAEAAAETPAETQTNETYAIAPAADTEQANGSTRSYTATGLGTTIVDVVIVSCSNVTVGTDGSTRFVNTGANGTNGIADGTGEDATNEDEALTAAAITSVNGSTRNPEDPTINNDYANRVTPVNGSVTFVVSGPSGSSNTSSCVVPVVFADDNTDDALNVAVANPALPNESFGTGGSVTFNPAAAGGGQFGPVDVDTNTESSDRFVACEIGVSPGGNEIVDPTACFSYRYDSNDRFQISSVDVTMAQFEVALSQDDDVSGTYADNPATRSTFNLLDEAPLAPGSPAEKSGSTNSTGTTITFSDSATASNDSYRLYRIVKPVGSEAGAAGCPAFSNVTHTSPKQIADTFSSSNPQVTPEITDTSASSSTTYCYRVIPVDDGDEGISSAAVVVTTTASAAGGAPTIIGATGSSADPFLTSADIHNLTFSEQMLLSPTASYTVTGTPSGTETIDCGGATPDALCVLSADSTQVRITITANMTPLAYPLTITAVSGMTDLGGVPVAVASSADKVIEQSTLTGDTARPNITAARVTEASGSAAGFGQVGDLLDVDFSEASRFTQGSSVTKDQLTAILGTTVDYATGSVTVSNSDSDTLRFTVVTALTDGVAIGDAVDGTSNGFVADTANNPQQANPGTPPTVTTA